MFNLIMQVPEWVEGRQTAHIERVFEHTDKSIIAKFTDNQIPDLDRLVRLPCLFMQEGTGEQVARVGRIADTRINGSQIQFDVAFDRNVPPVLNSVILKNKADFDIRSDFAFSRTHWAVKDVDLFKSLIRSVAPIRQKPKVFAIAEHERISPKLVAVMMPFDAGFSKVYETIKAASSGAGLLSKRVDEIWEDTTIIQDIVSLIDRARVVICDCTGKNANVFYEIGIAHTLGREVVMLTQNDADVPFDLRHHRYIRYLNNSEGLTSLAEKLTERLQSLIG